MRTSLKVETASAGTPPAWGDEFVLLEFNGPQLTLVDRGPDQQFLSMASDEEFESGVVRWLRVPISRLEKEALLIGAMSVREVFSKPIITVVDIDSTGSIILEGAVGRAALTELDLPAPDSVLPEEITGRFQVYRPNPVIILDGSGVRENTISIRALSGVLDPLQRLWDAIGQALYSRSVKSKGKVQAVISARTELMAQAFRPGSFEVSLQPADEAMFREVAEQYKHLAISASGDLSSTGMKRFSPRVQAVFRQFVRATARFKIDVFAKWDASGAMLTKHSSERMLQAIDNTSSDATEEEFETTGFFVGYNAREKSCEFSVLESGEAIRAEVSREASQRHPEVVVGHKEYSATFRAFYSGDPLEDGVRYVLIAFADLNRSS